MHALNYLKIGDLGAGGEHIYIYTSVHRHMDMSTYI